ncbi:MAG TPA: hypothetical protein VM686_20600, partial [Polyangiaceae bacterium]|nr:hypothetical protein [Polyangiaceae bacterium]
MKKRALVLGGVLLLCAAAGGAYYGVFTHQPEPDEPVEVAEKLARSYDRAIVVEPYDLAARVGPGFECGLVHGGLPMLCRSADWTVIWQIEPEERKAPTKELIDAAERATLAEAASNRESPGAEGFEARRSLAGFEGYVGVAQTMRRPLLRYSFTGWFPDPKRGRLRLRISAETTSTDEQVRVTAAGLAVLLTTAARNRAAGPASSWPSHEELLAKEQIRVRMAELAQDDAVPSKWVYAARSLCQVGRSPGLTELLKKRLEVLAPGSDALELLRCLDELDRAQAVPVAERLLQRTSDQAEQLELTVLLARGGRPGPLAELASKLEASENQLKLAPIAARGAIALAPLRAYVLAMLARRSPYGEARSEGGLLKLETPHGSRSAHRTQLSVPAGTKMRLR